MLKLQPLDYVYDLETYPNVFTFAAKHPYSGSRFLFELSYRKNQLAELIQFLEALRVNNARMVGFNNLYFDNRVLHFILDNYFRGLTPYEIYQYADMLINDGDRVPIVWNPYIEQLDLLKIHHFDNNAKRTSLKMLEFNMRQNRIDDLPFDPGTFLEPDQIDTLIEYNLDGDVESTTNFYIESLEMIAFRGQLSEQYGRSFLNHNDTKIGKDYLIMKLEQEKKGTCYKYVDGVRTPCQTWRDEIALNDVIFDYIKFEQPEFNRILQWLKSKTITETKGVFKDLHCTIGGFTYHFGTGGIHGSVESQTVFACENYTIIDLDVKSYYPNIGVKNRVYPEHLGELFCDVYEEVYKQRENYAKGTLLNKTLKLALNGVYGDSNNVYSPFYDPKYTMAITINGQLMLCMLAEYLMQIPDLQMVQINTDGLTIRCHRNYTETVNAIASAWELITKLELESATYSHMFIRDVNNYIAVYEGSGKLKNKGAYVYEDLEWHKNHSSLVIQKAAEAALVRGEDVADFIRNHDNVFDFMLRTKVPRSSSLELFADGESNKLQNICRYYVSNIGGQLFKVMPPLYKDFYVFKADGDWQQAKEKLEHKDIYYCFKNGFILVPTKEGCKILNKYGFTDTDTKSRSLGPERRLGINVGWLVTPCNVMPPHSEILTNINYDFYIAEAEKLVKPIRGY